MVDQTVMEYMNPMDQTVMQHVSTFNSMQTSEKSQKTEYRQMNTQQWEQVNKDKVKQAMKDSGSITETQQSMDDEDEFIKAKIQKGNNEEEKRGESMLFKNMNKDSRGSYNIKEMHAVSITGDHPNKYSLHEEERYQGIMSKQKPSFPF